MRRRRVAAVSKSHPGDGVCLSNQQGVSAKAHGVKNQIPIWVNPKLAKPLGGSVKEQPGECARCNEAQETSPAASSCQQQRASPHPFRGGIAQNNGRCAPDGPENGNAGQVEGGRRSEMRHDRECQEANSQCDQHRGVEAIRRGSSPYRDARIPPRENPPDHHQDQNRVKATAPGIGPIICVPIPAVPRISRRRTHRLRVPWPGWGGPSALEHLRGPSGPDGTSMTATQDRGRRAPASPGPREK